MAKDLVIVGNVILDCIQISTILHTLSSSWKIVQIALRLNSKNLTLEELSAQLKFEHQHLQHDKKSKLYFAKDAPNHNHSPSRLPHFKRFFFKGNGKFDKRKDLTFRKPQTTASQVKCFKCGKPGHFKKDC
jgi:hypothetical protein